jgi:predicted RNA-binding protein with PIN domain
MLTYIIDAFNVIHAVDSLKGSSRPHHDLISFIRNNKLSGSINNKVVVVFDGTFREDIQTGERNFKILFSHPKSADEIIIQRIKQLSKCGEIVVVTNDRALASEAKEKGAKVKAVGEFIKKIQTGNRKQPKSENIKTISYSLQREITEEMRKIWLGEDKSSQK